MLNRKQAIKYCCEKISLIENYDKAKRDLLETWHIHHRKEDEGYSKQELIYLGLYYDRPASELIFLTKSEHLSLHNKGEKHYLYGNHHSDETKKKISEAMKGKHHSEESRRKISEARKGKHHSEETRRKMKGKHRSEETRRKMSEARKGKHHSEETRRKISESNSRSSKPVLQIDKKTGNIIKTWACVAEVGRLLGVDYSHIYKCCSGKRKSAFGYIWTYCSTRSCGDLVVDN